MDAAGEVVPFYIDHIYVGYQNAPRSHLVRYMVASCLGTVSASSETMALAISLVLLLYIYLFLRNVLARNSTKCSLFS
jgi:hypothetical protein